MFIRLVTIILVLSMLACVCNARIKTFNEVIKYGVDEETRKILQKSAGSTTKQFTETWSPQVDTWSSSVPV